MDKAESVERVLAVDPAECTRDELFERLVELDQLISRAQARRERFLAALYEPDDPKQWAREEVACALRWSVGYTEARLAQAEELVTRWPAVLALHEAGQLSDAHARAAAEAGYRLHPGVVAAVQDRVLPRSGEQTVTQFRAALRRAVARLDPRGEQDKHDAARADRLVRLSPLPDGMAGLWSTHTAVDAAAIYARLTEQANAAGEAAQEGSAGPGAGVGEGVDARRADALRDLVLGTTAATPARHARVQVLMPQATAAGLSDAPGELAGYGPIPASQCRAVLADPSARLERLTVDDRGRVLPVAIAERPTRRYPNAAQTRFITARFPTCRFPTCNRRATGCEIDHTHPYNGHNTTTDNLAPLCRRHHHLKHDARGWSVRRDPNGTFHWRAPHGRVYRTSPDELPTADP